MKKIYILLVLALLPMLAVAQFRYSPVIGVNFNNLNFKQDIVPISQSTGFQVGVAGELMFPGIGFGVDFGLLYNMEGAKINLGDRKIWSSVGLGNENLMIHTIQIPFHLRFKWTRMNGFEDILAPFVYGGPEVGIVAAHSNFKGTDNVHPFRYAGVDLGLAAGGGVEIMRKWQVMVQYTWGVTYITKTRKLENYSANNRQLAVRVAYMF